MRIFNVNQAARLFADYGNVHDDPEMLLKTVPDRLSLYAAKLQCLANVDRAFILLESHFGLNEQPNPQPDSNH